jgi:hypothetical protein
MAVGIGTLLHVPLRIIFKHVVYGRVVSAEDIRKIVEDALRKYNVTRSAVRAQVPPVFPPSPYVITNRSTMEGVPVYILGRDPPYVGDLIGYQPEVWGGEEYYRLYIGMVEIWAQVLDSDDNVVGYYPYYVRGLPSWGAIIAHEHAERVNGSIVLFKIGITNPITNVVVPARSILWLDKVFEGKMRAIIADPAGILRVPEYEVATRFYQLQELVRQYSYAANALHRENLFLRSLLQAKDYEARKYMDLATVYERNYLNLVGLVHELKGQLELMERELAYMQKMHIADREHIEYLSSQITRMKDIINDLMAVLSQYHSAVLESVRGMVEEERRKKGGKAAQQAPAQVPVQAQAQPQQPQQGGGYV